VYLTKKVHRNGQKSTVNAYAKATQQEVPDILRANTYFWHPAGAAWQRRRNEEKRNEELAEFEVDNSIEMREKIREYASPLLQKREAVGYDEYGIYLRYRKENYHLDKGVLNAKTLQAAREGIAIRRRKNAQDYLQRKEAKMKEVEAEKIFREKAAHVFVTRGDSLQAGNCRVGTDNFISGLPLTQKGFHVRAMRGDALLALRDDSFTRRAVKQAISHS
jgi:hypothetical protein